MTTDKSITRPGVRCRCKRLHAFADGRWGKFRPQVCSGCFAIIYRKDKGGKVLYRNLLGAVHELERVEILHKGI